MGTKPLRVATRDSRLALHQVEETLERILPLLPDYSDYTVVRLGSPGDRDRATPLTNAAVPEDFFTRDTDEALRANEADIAIHSAKDLPEPMPDGLGVAALLPARDIRDALVLRTGLSGDASPAVIGTSSPRRETEARRLFPDAEIKPLRGTIPDRLQQLDRGDFDAVIIAACALDRLGLTERMCRHLPYDPAPQQGRLAVVARTDAQDIYTALRAIDVRRTAGLVAVVGCPADADLLSMRAQRYLRQANVVLHDRLLPDDVLLSIRGKAIPVGKAAGTKTAPQSEIHRMMLEEAEQGRLIVRLKGGDPGIYGHLAEELTFLSDWNLRFDVVPAVTAAQVAAARAGAALTHRGTGRGLTVLSGHRPDQVTSGKRSGPGEGNLAIYMGVEHIKSICRQLIDDGWRSDTPLLIGERVGYKDEATYASTLAEAAGCRPSPPAVFLVGVKTFPSRHTALFVGTDPEHFLKYGPLIHRPLIRLVSRPLAERVDILRTELESARGVLFPGRFAVRAFMEALLDWRDTRALVNKALLAVGPATADELLQYGLRADRAAAALGGVRELARSLTPELAGRYLYPCSDAAPREERTDFMAAHGIELQPHIFYVNRATPYKEIPRLPFSRVIFTSTSTVNVYFENHPGELRADRTWIAVGPSTRRALEDLGLHAEMLDS